VAFKTQVFVARNMQKTAKPVYVPALLPTFLYERPRTNCSVSEEVPPAGDTTGNPPHIRRDITARCAAQLKRYTLRPLTYITIHSLRFHRGQITNSLPSKSALSSRLEDETQYAHPLFLTQ